MPARRRVTASLVFFLASCLLASCLGDGFMGIKGSRFDKPIIFKILSSTPTQKYASVIENALRDVGVPVSIETVEQQTLIESQRNGQFQITTGRWVGGNQDPVFFRNLFRTGANFNRGRYSNPELDAVLDETAATYDRERARQLYAQAQDIISREVPMLPLWYASQMLVARRNVTGVTVNMSGDWKFLRSLRVEGKSGPLVAAIESMPQVDQLYRTDAASERMRQLIYNTLVTKDEKFDYVGELAEYTRAPDGLSYTFTLRDGVRFHNGRALTSADVKHTLETVLSANPPSPKSGDFFEGVAGTRTLYESGYVTAIETPDARTVVIRLRTPWLNLLSNLVTIGIFPQGSTAEEQKRQPVGTGFYRFVRLDESQQTIDFVAHENYWGGAPAVKNLRVRAILDSNTLQAELKSGGIDVAVVGNLQPEDFQQLGQDPDLRVENFPGANVVYLLFNAQDDALKDARVRRAISYAIDRESIVRNVLLNQARVAHSILPPESWAYHPGQVYNYDPAQAKRILDEAGYTAQ